MFRLAFQITYYVCTLQTLDFADCPVIVSLTLGVRKEIYMPNWDTIVFSLYCNMHNIVLNYLPNSCRRRPEEFDMQSRKRPRIDYPPEFPQRPGHYLVLITLLRVTFLKE